LVIFCVALVEAMRTRMSFSDAILVPAHQRWTKSIANPLVSSCPALCRASTSCLPRPKDVDGRVKPGHDGTN
jgi:hypothetical protein